MTQPKLEPGEHTVRINLHTAEPMKNNLIEMAEEGGVSLNEITRQMIAGNEEYKIFANKRK